MRGRGGGGGEREDRRRAPLTHAPGHRPSLPLHSLLRAWSGLSSLVWQLVLLDLRSLTGSRSCTAWIRAQGPGSVRHLHKRQSVCTLASSLEGILGLVVLGSLSSTCYPRSSGSLGPDPSPGACAAAYSGALKTPLKSRDMACYWPVDAGELTLALRARSVVWGWFMVAGRTVPCAPSESWDLIMYHGCGSGGGTWAFKDLLLPARWAKDLSLQKLPPAAWPPPASLPVSLNSSFSSSRRTEEPLNGAELEVT